MSDSDYKSSVFPKWTGTLKRKITTFIHRKSTAEHRFPHLFPKQSIFHDPMTHPMASSNFRLSLGMQSFNLVAILHCAFRWVITKKRSAPIGVGSPSYMLRSLPLLLANPLGSYSKKIAYLNNSKYTRHHYPRTGVCFHHCQPSSSGSWQRKIPYLPVVSPIQTLIMCSWIPGK